MPQPASAVEKSQNAKIGEVHATYASQQSCPESCPLKNAGCYAESGNVGIHTRRLNKADPNATPLEIAEAEAAAIRKLSGTLNLRLHVVGDCTTDEAAKLVSGAAEEVVIAKGQKAWSYTHAWRDVQRESWGEVSVLASCENPTEIREAQALGWATAIVVDEHDSQKMYERDGMKILPCVNQTHDITCVDCQLCWKDKHLLNKGITIAFAAHGSRTNMIKKMLPTIQ